MRRGNLTIALALGFAAICFDATVAPVAAFDVQACYRGCRGNQQCQENCENRQFEGRRPAGNSEQCTVRNGRRECVTKLVPADD